MWRVNEELKFKSSLFTHESKFRVSGLGFTVVASALLISVNSLCTCAVHMTSRRVACASMTAIDLPMAVKDEGFESKRSVSERRHVLSSFLLD